MFGLPSYVPFVAGAVAVFALGGLVLDRNHLAALNHQHAACQASIAGKGGAWPASLTCVGADAPIAVLQTRADNAATCDLSLTLKGDGAPAVQCSPAVQNLAADRSVQAAMVADRDAQLAAADARTTAAVTRAQARGQAQAQRNARDVQVLQSAPRDADGGVVLDERSLRVFAGESAPGA